MTDVERSVRLDRCRVVVVPGWPAGRLVRWSGAVLLIGPDGSSAGRRAVLGAAGRHPAEARKVLDGLLAAPPAPLPAFCLLVDSRDLPGRPPGAGRAGLAVLVHGGVDLVVPGEGPDRFLPGAPAGASRQLDVATAVGLEARVAASQLPAAFRVDPELDLQRGVVPAGGLHLAAPVAGAGVAAPAGKAEAAPRGFVVVDLEAGPVEEAAPLPYAAPAPPAGVPAPVAPDAHGADAPRPAAPDTPAAGPVVAAEAVPAGPTPATPGSAPPARPGPVAPAPPGGPAAPAAAPPAGTAAPVTRAAGPEVAGTAPGATSPAWTLVLESGRRVAVDGPVVVGREPAADPAVRDGTATALAFVESDVSVSRIHAELRPTAAGVEVTDRGSTNGTFVLGRTGGWARIEAGVAVPVAPGGQVAFGQRVARVEAPGPASEA